MSKLWHACTRMSCIAFAAALACQGLGCVKPQAVVIDDLFDPVAMPRPWLPDEADLAAARLARAALLAEAPTGAFLRPDSSSQNLDPDTPAAADPRVERALADLESRDGCGSD